MKNYDVIVVGSGLAGAVYARKAAEGGKRVLIIEKRGHIGGNAYDKKDEAGVLIHLYGPHIFHTNSEAVYQFLSRFTAWNGYSHKVVARIGENEIPVPFNLNSLYKVFDSEKAKAIEEKLIALYGTDVKIPIIELKKSNDPDLFGLAEYVYENVFLHYTVKQWGKKPEEIDPATTARVPVYVSRDDRYFQDKYQGLPTDGYTALFERMLCHDNIELRLSTDAKELLSFREGKIFFEGEEFSGKVVYTGAIDQLFDYEFGALPYRTLNFCFESFRENHVQSHGTVNYTVSEDYTRITEFKHMTLQSIEGKTSTVKEFSKEYDPKTQDIPYYPIINEENEAVYKKYKNKAESFNNLILLGRLAEYKYYNMDKIVENALGFFQ